MRRIFSRDNLVPALLSVVPTTGIVLALVMWGMGSSARNMPPVPPPNGSFGAEFTWWVIRPIAQFFAHGHVAILAIVAILLWLVITWVVIRLRAFYLAHPSLHITMVRQTRGNANR